MIPLVDLKAQYHSIKPEIDAAIQTVIDEAAFYQGKHVKAFEDKFAAMFGVKHCVGVANCTDALYIALRTLGIGKGDEVITAAGTFIATAEAITATGASVVFCDTNVVTGNLDVGKIRPLINSATAAIVPVHMSGRAVDMTAIMALAKEFDLKVVEDCAQSPWAEWEGKKVGTIGDVGCFSFYPSKNLGAYGDAGCIVTDDPALEYKMRMMANHGQNNKHVHYFEGVSSRLDGIQAAILTVKLDYLAEWCLRRYDHATWYAYYLRDVKNLILPDIPAPKLHVFHVFQVRVNPGCRAAIRLKMEAAGIQTGMHYFLALPNQPAYSYLKLKAVDFPVATTIQDSNISLPMYPELTEGQIKLISATLRECVNAASDRL